MIKQLIFFLFIILFVSACDVGNSTDEAVWRFTREFEFIIVDSAKQPVIGFDANQYRPDSVDIFAPSVADTVDIWEGYFDSCGVSGPLQWLISRPYITIDTAQYFIRLSDNDVDTFPVFHYYYKPDDFYYKIFEYNGNSFDERIDVYKSQINGCGEGFTQFIKYNK